MSFCFTLKWYIFTHFYIIQDLECYDARARRDEPRQQAATVFSKHLRQDHHDGPIQKDGIGQFQARRGTDGQGGEPPGGNSSKGDSQDKLWADIMCN